MTCVNFKLVTYYLQERYVHVRRNEIKDVVPNNLFNKSAFITTLKQSSLGKIVQFAILQGSS